MKVFKILLILGVCLGLNLDAGECPCKAKKKHEKTRMEHLKKEKKERHKACDERADKAFKDMKKRRKEEKKDCHCTGVFQTIPADKVLALDGKIKRDSGGNRV